MAVELLDFPEGHPFGLVPCEAGNFLNGGIPVGKLVIQIKTGE